MDPIKIIKRAWQILWSYRALWIFGMLVALTAGGFFPPRGGGNSGGGGGESSQPGYPFRWEQREGIEENLRHLREWMEEGFPPITFTDPGIQVWITLGIALLVILLVWAVILVTARYVAEIALMRMVEDYERNGEKASIRQGLRFGWSRSAWRMFLISLLLSLPVILVLLLIPVAGLVMFLVITQWNPFTSVVGIVGSVGLFFLALFLAIMLGALLILLRHFMWRACALEGLGVRQAMRQGFELARRNWQSVGLLWVMMIGLRILWGLAVMLAGLALIPVMLVTLAVGVVAAALPAFLVGGIASLFLGGPWSWILGAIFGLPILLIVGLSPLIFWRGLEMTFDSAVWTLAYRELKLLEELEPAAETTEG